MNLSLGELGHRGTRMQSNDVFEVLNMNNENKLLLSGDGKHRDFSAEYEGGITIMQWAPMEALIYLIHERWTTDFGYCVPQCAGNYENAKNRIFRLRAFLNEASPSAGERLISTGFNGNWRFEPTCDILDIHAFFVERTEPNLPPEIAQSLRQICYRRDAA